MKTMIDEFRPFYDDLYRMYIEFQFAYLSDDQWYLEYFQDNKEYVKEQDLDLFKKCEMELRNNKIKGLLNINI